MELVRDSERMSAVDIVHLSAVEVYAALVHLAGHRDDRVAAAVTEAVQQVLQRTRPSLP